jgi:hypothetical protein
MPIATTQTFDSTDNPSNLSAQEADEKESMEIGERLISEQERQLAGKYNSAEELEAAYLALQKKLGEKGAEEEPQEPQEEAEEPEEVEEVEEDISLLLKISEEAEGGEFSEETLKALEGLSSTDVANMFLAYQERNPAGPQKIELSEQDVAEMKGIVGGEQEYQAMCSWAAENLPPEEVQVFDYVVTELGDPRAVYFAIQAMNYRFREAVGFEPQLLGGRSPSDKGDVFESHAQLVAAMNDPRYDKDPAYRAAVEAKLERSPEVLNF